MARTTEEVTKYFAEQNCELLDEYTHCMQKIKYRCSCGEIGYTSWNNFSRGRRCGHCARHGHAKKRTLTEVRKTFRERGCKFLDDEFRGIHYKHRYCCQCGREAEITFAAFHYQNQLCFECGRKKNTGPGNHGWIEDREQKRLNDLFRKKCYSALRYTLATVGKKKVGRTSDMLGYGHKELQEHIKSHPNWTKVKDGDWHLDHIFPINAFLEHGITDVALINSLDNLQPITQRENNTKHAKYDRKKFRVWLEKRKRTFP